MIAMPGIAARSFAYERAERREVVAAAHARRARRPMPLCSGRWTCLQIFGVSAIAAIDVVGEVERVGRREAHALDAVDGGHRAQQLARTPTSSQRYEFTVWPRSCTSLTPAATSARTWRRISRGAAPRSRPRVYGTTQNVQNLSQPRWIVTWPDHAVGRRSGSQPLVRLARDRGACPSTGAAGARLARRWSSRRR